MGRNWHFTNRSNPSKPRIVAILRKGNGELIVFKTKPMLPSAAWRRQLAAIKAFD